ncbi:MAG: hypothetical protein LBK12_04640 [Odoribacteraceae bacterium]|jgi:hypothetical protein|nr:hypothetical protein [Odoribacteraceae bacterium]
MKTTLTVLALLLLAGTARAQVVEKRNPRTTIAVQPVNWVNGSFGVDVERRMKNPRHWLQVNLLAHTVTNNGPYEEWWTFYSEDDPFQRLRGLRLGVSYKIFFHRLFYYSAGVTYDNFRVRYRDSFMQAFEEEGLTFHEYVEDVLVNQRFDKLSTAIRAGFFSTFRHAVFVDVYAGLGYAYSFYDETKRAYDGGVFTFGYRGIFPSVGARFGVSF